MDIAAVVSVNTARTTGKRSTNPINTTTMLYFYKAVLERVVDGDTIVAMVDLGFHTWKKVTIRLIGIDAPETRGGTEESKAQGEAAKAWLQQILPSTFYMSSTKLDSFGRSLAILYASEWDAAAGTSIQALMVQAGHAVISNT